MSLLAHTSPLEHAVLVAIAVLGIGVYGDAWLHERARDRTVSVWRLVAWTAGIAALLVATSPTVERWATESFAGHMIQHLLMIVVAAPVLVLARPVRVLERRWRGPGHRVRFRHARVWWRSSGPLVAPVLFVVTLFVTHLTGIYDAALSNRLIHDLEHLAYVGAACALWSVGLGVGRGPAAARVGAVFGVIAGSALLGVVLLTAPSPLVPTYVDQLGADAALDDQRLAATLMWIGGMAITLPLLITAVWRWASAEERAA